MFKQDCSEGCSDGQFFSSVEDAKNKNPDDPDNNFFSILDKLEEYRQNDGRFRFKLCYTTGIVSKWGDNGRQCNEWYQTSNPVTTAATAAVSGFQAISLAYKYAPGQESWNGIKRSSFPNKLIEDMGGFTNIGVTGDEPFYGPRHPIVQWSLTKKVELYVMKNSGFSGKLTNK